MRITLDLQLTIDPTQLTVLFPAFQAETVLSLAL
jgi:hypothetical protein